MAQLALLNVYIHTYYFGPYVNLRASTHFSPSRLMNDLTRDSYETQFMLKGKMDSMQLLKSKVGSLVEKICVILNLSSGYSYVAENR